MVTSTKAVTFSALLTSLPHSYHSPGWLCWFPGHPMAATPALLYVHQLLPEIYLGVMGFLLGSEFLRLSACRKSNKSWSGNLYNIQTSFMSAKSNSYEETEMQQAVAYNNKNRFQVLLVTLTSMTRKVRGFMAFTSFHCLIDQQRLELHLNTDLLTA